jgi:hypothetical protein
VLSPLKKETKATRSGKRKKTKRRRERKTKQVVAHRLWVWNCFKVIEEGSLQADLKRKITKGKKRRGADDQECRTSER